MENWSDYPIFMAIAQTGSLTAAGQKLGLSQPTIGRRLKALEDALGGPIVKKQGGRLAPTQFGLQVLEHIQRMSEEADAITRQSAALEQSLAGPITIAASQGLGDEWLPFAIFDLQTQHPDILLNLSINMHAANLAQREADIALRWMGPGHQNSLIGRKAVSVGFGIYASSEYINRAGRPNNTQELADHDAVTVLLDGNDLFWKEALGTTPYQPARFTLRADSIQAHKMAIAAGFGIGPIPHCAAIPMGLERILPDFEKTVDLWVVAHEDLRKSARMRVAFDYLLDALQKDARHLRYGEDSIYRMASSLQLNAQASAQAAE